MNKHIELVKKWLDKPESVSLGELKVNKEAAYRAAVFDYAAEVAKAAEVATIATIAAAATAATAEAVYWAADVAAEAAYWAADAAAEAAYRATFEAAEAATTAVYWRNIAIKHIEKYEELTK